MFESLPIVLPATEATKATDVDSVFIVFTVCAVQPVCNPWRVIQAAIPSGAILVPLVGR